jgi:predicted TIM-barrel fold metal-dependent hydrolase
VPNEYVFSLAEKNPELFIPVISVHPYRKDALDELTKFAKRGGKMVKWLPNAMGIDPSDVKCEPFYKKMKELHLVLLSHTGMELAVEAKEDQRYGNPLLLKKPLDMGVKVIMAHCASLGESTDLEDPTKKMVNNFDLFIRLMGNKKYEGLLFADISALTQINRSGEPLKTMLHRTDLQYRLVNGSDYPLPAVDIVISLNKLILSKYITKQEADYLSDIYKYNPLLFDFVLKRTLKDPETGKHFLTTIFMRNNDLEN